MKYLTNYNLQMCRFSSFECPRHGMLCTIHQFLHAQTIYGMPFHEMKLRARWGGGQQICWSVICLKHRGGRKMIIQRNKIIDHAMHENYSTTDIFTGA
jgi:hypothetical protein